MTWNRTVATSAVAVLLAIALPAARSGPIGIYGVVERVVFEPNETTPERVQVWGAFAFAEDAVRRAVTDPYGGLAISAVERGYLYFKVPEVAGPGADPDLVRREWRDLRASAGTGQAVGFGRWGYTGSFSTPTSELRVRAAGEPPAAPAIYRTNMGVVRISADGTHAALVAQLRAALAK